MSSQKFIARNRAPRVQIEYDVELYGAEKKVQLPFVMGVMADLAGKPADPLPPVADRHRLQGRRTEQVAASPPAVVQPRHLHGRQGRRRGTDQQGAERPRAAA